MSLGAVEIDSHGARDWRGGKVGRQRGATEIELAEMGQVGGRGVGRSGHILNEAQQHLQIDWT